MKKLNLILIATLALFVAGCGGRLATGGAYAKADQSPDIALFSADSAFDLAYASLDTVFATERANREMLWKLSPDIKHTLDKIRVESSRAKLYYAVARKAYLANPVAANLTGVQEALARIQQLSTAAIAVLPKGN